jgi:hypothetical protein
LRFKSSKGRGGEENGTQRTNGTNGSRALRESGIGVNYLDNGDFPVLDFVLVAAGLVGVLVGGAVEDGEDTDFADGGKAIGPFGSGFVGEAGDAEVRVSEEAYPGIVRAHGEFVAGG